MFEYSKSIAINIIARAQHVLVGLVLLDFGEQALHHPEEGVEPEERLHHAQRDLVARMAVADVRRFVRDDHRALRVVRPLLQAEEDSPPEGERRTDARVLRKGVFRQRSEPGSFSEMFDPKQAADQECQQEQDDGSIAGEQDPLPVECRRGACRRGCCSRWAEARGLRPRRPGARHRNLQIHRLRRQDGQPQQRNDHRRQGRAQQETPASPVRDPARQEELVERQQQAAADDDLQNIDACGFHGATCS